MGPTETEGPPPTPRWVKLFAVGAVVLLLLLAIVLVVVPGDHGPGRHAPLFLVPALIGTSRFGGLT